MSVAVIGVLVLIDLRFADPGTGAAGKLAPVFFFLGGNYTDFKPVCVCESVLCLDALIL